MLEKLIQSVKDHAQRNAFCINEEYYSYFELYNRIQSIAAGIVSHGGSSTGRIGIVTTNSIETYASIIACWYCGCAYVPLSPAIPQQRNSFSAKEAGIDIVLTATGQSLPEIINTSLPIRLINTSTLHAYGDSDVEMANLTDESLMYILFTSGSTGTPKGVPINYGNLHAFIDSYECLGFNSDQHDRFLQMFDLTFDVSVASYIIPLLKGACIYTVPVEGVKYMNVLKVLKNHKITFASIVPSIINYLKPYYREISLPDLKYCILTAEASALGNVKQWINCMPNGELINLYGPTEATIWCTGYFFDQEAPKSYHEMLAIGRPFKNVEAFILDEAGNESGTGIKGELCIASAQLTKGYLNDEERTGISFFNKGHHRLYKTGDLCYKDESGDIFYCGRIDHQVKIHGFRIELNEIEAVVKELINAGNIAVIYKNKIGLDQICLYIEKYEGEIGDLKMRMEQILPYYMIPAQIKTIQELPHNASSKIDRALLSKLATENEN